MTGIMTDILIDCLTSPVTENGVFSEKFVELEKKTVIDNIETAINDKRSYAIERAMKPSVRASLQAYAHTAR